MNAIVIVGVGYLFAPFVDAALLEDRRGEEALWSPNANPNQLNLN
ncbi:MAG: hypothetical protein Q8N26_01725 [Myxococcales bacterium]|nr:hypothetical protein [Myxococcales bacterium]